MKYDLLIAGVGGQGILSLAYVLDNAALELGVYFKQTEVHGMAQRGGGVVSHFRMSSDPIHSDMIPLGGADLILGIEPLEALRYVQYLHPQGMILTNTEPVLNIGNYPAIDKVKEALTHYNHIIINADELAKKAGHPNTQNMVLLGAVSQYIHIPENILLHWVKECFQAKGEKMVELNCKAFQLGRDSVKK